MTELLRLSDYFHPLNFETLPLFLLLLIFFDSLGTFIKNHFINSVKPDNSRVINWLIGLGFFIFVWFLLRFFIPPQRTPVLISILVLSTLSLPSYIKNREIMNVLTAFWQVKIPLLVIAFFLPAVFVKASLPPYYADEMAYQFLAPYYLKIIGIWRFNGGLYSNVPQLFNTFFDLIFSLSKTYSIVRLTHFFILTTSMVFAYQKLKEHFGYLSGFFFVFAFFSLPIDIVLTATLGYVDVATYSFLLIGLMSGIDFIFSKSSASLSLSAVFWGMALGTKYTSTTIFVTFTASYLFALFITRRSSFRQIINPTTLFRLSLILLVFGGYWYLKNLLVYGNPIYPFLLPCFRYGEYCQTQAANFFAWTTPITLKNLPGIIRELLPGNRPLQLALLASPVLALLNRNSKTRLLTWILTSTIVIELFVLKQFSGFYPRYQQHLELLMLLLIAIQLANQYRDSTIDLVAKILYLVVFAFILASFITTINTTNSLNFVNWTEINYARGKLSIYDWIEEKFPRVSAGLRWCENPPSGQPTPVSRFDPDMIWYEYDGFMRSFMTNCYLENAPLDGLPLDQVLAIAVKNKMKFWTITPNPCLPQNKVEKHLSYEGDHQLYLRRLNNIVVCNSTQVKSNLYYFDYQTVDLPRDVAR